MIRTECSSCHDPVVWCLTATGKKMPVNTWTAERGNIVMEDPESDEPVIRVLKKGERTHEPKYLSHFVTCKDAKAHRRAK